MATSSTITQNTLASCNAATYLSFGGLLLAVSPVALWGTRRADVVLGKVHWFAVTTLGLLDLVGLSVA